jgi:PEP-CTERM motif
METINMKKISKAILSAALGLALVPTVKASSEYDLLLGFTQNGGNSTGNDLIIDIGPAGPFYAGQNGLTDGETWNLSSLLSSQNFNLSSVQWGVIGDASYSDGQNPQSLWVTTSGMTAHPVPSDATFNSIDLGINSIESTDFGGLSNPNQSTTIAAGNQNSWSQQTINGTFSSQFDNAYGNPNVTGETSDTLWQVNEGGSITDLGNFSLNSSGVLTFTAAPVPEPGTIGLLSMGGLLVLAWRHRFNSRKA